MPKDAKDGGDAANAERADENFEIIGVQQPHIVRARESRAPEGARVVGQKLSAPRLAIREQQKRPPARRCRARSSHTHAGGRDTAPDLALPENDRRHRRHRSRS